MSPDPALLDPALLDPALLDPALLDRSLDGAALWWSIAALLAALPFLLVMVTCFTKMVVVLSIVRNALGVHDVPPNLVILGVSLALTLPVMAPLASDVAAAVERAVSQPSRGDEDRADAPRDPAAIGSVTGARALGDAAARPVRRFLARHADARHRATFAELATSLRARDPEAPSSKTSDPKSSDPKTRDPKSSEPKSSEPETAASKSRDPEARENTLAVLIPAFLTTELTEAFTIGFLLLLPFVMVDLVVVAVLSALGMSTISPSSVALPIKLLLFVTVDGWHIIARGLLLGYA